MFWCFQVLSEQSCFMKLIFGTIYVIWKVQLQRLVFRSRFIVGRSNCHSKKSPYLYADNFLPQKADLIITQMGHRPSKRNNVQELSLWNFLFFERSESEFLHISFKVFVVSQKKLTLLDHFHAWRQYEISAVCSNDQAVRSTYDRQQDIIFVIHPYLGHSFVSLTK